MYITRWRHTGFNNNAAVADSTNPTTASVSEDNPAVVDIYNLTTEPEQEVEMVPRDSDKEMRNKSEEK